MKQAQLIRLLVIVTILVTHFLTLLAGFYWGRIEGQNNLWDTQWNPNRYVESFPTVKD